MFLDLPPETPEEEAYRRFYLEEARGWPPREECVIEDLTDEEADAFLRAIAEL
jgi:hypothetical protein